MNTQSSLVAELREKEYRDAYVASQIRIGLPFQVRALRKSRDWTQAELGEAAGMAQSRVAEIERGKRSLNLETLQRLASAFDVALDVRFVPFGELIDRTERFDPDRFTVPAFDAELKTSVEQDHAVRQRLLPLTVLIFDRQKSYQSESVVAVNSLTMNSSIGTIAQDDLALETSEYVQHPSRLVGGIR